MKTILVSKNSIVASNPNYNIRKTDQLNHIVIPSNTKLDCQWARNRDDSIDIFWGVDFGDRCKFIFNLHFDTENEVWEIFEKNK